MQTVDSHWENRERSFVMGNANKDVVINNNTPHTPRKRGAEIASLENYSLALDLWRTTCAEAGLAFIVDNCTANGARKVAARYLDTGALTPEAIKRAMCKLAYLITHNERAQHYTLNALGNNISRYLEPSKREPTQTVPERVLWEFTCSACHTTAAGFYPADSQPLSTPCGRRGCDGVMIARRG